MFMKIFVNGTFDILHRGHIELLNYAKSLGDFLLVGIDTDDRVKEKKGPTRPIHSQEERKFFLENLKAVDGVDTFSCDEELENMLEAGDMATQIESKEMLPSESQNTTEIKPKVTLVQLFELPTQDWPMNRLTLPTNMLSGQKVHIEHHDINEPLEDSMKRCFDKLPTERVLIIVFCEMISLGLIDKIAKIRGQGRPLVVDGSTKLDNNSANDREYQIIIRDWLINPKRDLIASSSVIAGFEWPSVLIITSNNFKSQFHIRNIVMRAMSRLVWLKTDSLDDIQEREVDQEEQPAKKRLTNRLLLKKHQNLA